MYTSRIIRLVAILITIGLIALGCASDGVTQSEDSAVTDIPVTSTSVSDRPATPDSVASPESTTTVATSPTPSEHEVPDWARDATSFTGAVFDSTAPLMTAKFAPLATGAHRSDVLGTEMSFEVNDDWQVRPNGTPWLVLTSPSAQAPGDRDLVFIRPGELSDPKTPDVEAGFPIDDIDAWIEQLIPGVVVGEPENVKLGGNDARVFHIELADDVRCESVGFCIGFVTNRFVATLGFTKSSRYRVYWVDQGDEDPIAVVAGSPRSDDTWFDTADRLLETVAFGTTRPNPVGDGDVIAQGLSAPVAAGSLSLPIGSGVAFDLDADAFIAQEPGKAIVRQPAGWYLGVVLVAANEAGDELATAGEVALTIEADPDITATRRPDEQVANLDAVVLDLARPLAPPTPNQPDVLTDGGGWSMTEQAARAWIVDSPDGPLMFTAEGSSRNFDQALEWAESVIATLRIGR